MDAAILPVELEKCFRLINHGPTVLVSARHEGLDNVMTAAWCCALDFSPPKLSVVISKEAKTRELIEKSGRFVIQVPTVRQVGMTQDVGSCSLADHPNKLKDCGVELFSIPGEPLPFVSGCSAWLSCRLLPEPGNQERYDLLIAEITGAWADTHVFRNGHWHFESADPGWRSLHHVAGGHFYAIGDPVVAGAS